MGKKLDSLEDLGLDGENFSNLLKNMEKGAPNKEILENINCSDKGKCQIFELYHDCLENRRFVREYCMKEGKGCLEKQWIIRKDLNMKEDYD